MRGVGVAQRALDVHAEPGDVLDVPNMLRREQGALGLRGQLVKIRGELGE
jgi:hypothetical protein